MIYHLSLQTAGLIAGLFLLLVSVPGLIKPELARGFAQRLPRSRVAGFTLLTVDLFWSLWLLATMEMGEFSSFRRPLLIILPIGFFLVLEVRGRVSCRSRARHSFSSGGRAAARCRFLSDGNKPASRDGVRISFDRRWIVLGHDAVSSARSDKLECAHAWALAFDARSRFALRSSDSGVRRHAVLISRTAVCNRRPSWTHLIRRRRS